MIVRTHGLFLLYTDACSTFYRIDECLSVFFGRILPALVLIFSVLPFPAFCEDAPLEECVKSDSALDNRVCAEKHISKARFAIVPYKPNYIIGSYVDELSGGAEDYQNYETKFQISFKIPLSRYEKPRKCLLLANTQCVAFFGYTQLSVWQMMNFERSAPFRDTNFEPEIMVAQLLKKPVIAGWNLRLVNYGLWNHQSNGKSPPSSRSWNRSYIDFVFEKNNSYITFKAWERWNEHPKDNPADFKGDDNVDIEKYVGNVELKYFHVGERANYSIVIRDSEKNANKANVQLNWSIPIKELSSAFDVTQLRFYVQYYNGFGETLIDYNVKRERIGMGIMLTDWL